jgi:hypothetical protein
MLCNHYTPVDDAFLWIKKMYMGHVRARLPAPATQNRTGIPAKKKKRASPVTARGRPKNPPTTPYFIYIGLEKQGHSWELYLWTCPMAHTWWKSSDWLCIWRWAAAASELSDQLNLDVLCSSCMFRICLSMNAKSVIIQNSFELAAHVCSSILSSLAVTICCSDMADAPAPSIKIIVPVQISRSKIIYHVHPSFLNP